MYVGRVYIEPEDVLNRMSEEDKKKFNQCVFTKSEIMLDGSVDLFYVAFNDEDKDNAETLKRKGLDALRVKYLD